MGPERTLKYGPQIVLFCGGRDCTEASHGALVRGDIFGLTRGSLVLHGGGRGLDMLADRYGRKFARERELHVVRVDALWQAWGNPAGPRRNRAMMMLRPDFAFAYPTGGPGTRDMLGLLVAADVPHVIREAVAA
jgi:hypothetical protein